jgi:hypothetical protein
MNCDFLSWSRSTNVYDESVIKCIEEYKGESGLIIIKHGGIYSVNRLRNISFKGTWFDCESLQWHIDKQSMDGVELIYSSDSRIYDIKSLLEEYKKGDIHGL